MRRDFAREQTICTEYDDLWAERERNDFFDRRNRKNKDDGNEDLRNFKRGILKKYRIIENAYIIVKLRMKELENLF